MNKKVDNLNVAWGIINKILIFDKEDYIHSNIYDKLLERPIEYFEFRDGKNIVRLEVQHLIRKEQRLLSSSSYHDDTKKILSEVISDIFSNLSRGGNYIYIDYDHGKWGEIREEHVYEFHDGESYKISLVMVIKSDEWSSEESIGILSETSVANILKRRKRSGNGKEFPSKRMKRMGLLLLLF